jgi:hypothetical protein
MSACCEIHGDSEPLADVPSRKKQMALRQASNYVIFREHLRPRLPSVAEKALESYHACLGAPSCNPVQHMEFWISQEMKNWTGNIDSNDDAS